MPTTRLLITGCRGQLGTDLLQILSRDYEVIGIDLPEIDILNEAALFDIVQQAKPAVVIHPAAYTDVDGCESKRELAMAVNGEGTRNVARACEAAHARLIYYSTDYVFDGSKSTAYLETDSTSPATIYGESKLAGEKAIAEELKNYAIMRIAWLYGAHGNNFVKTMTNLGKKQIEARESAQPYQSLKVVDDQHGNPTWTVDVVNQTRALIESDQIGIFHATSEGETTWYQFAKDIFRLGGLEVEIIPCTTEQFPRPASRPRMSALINARLNQLGSNRMRPYIDALEEFLKTVLEKN